MESINRCYNKNIFEEIEFTLSNSFKKIEFTLSNSFNFFLLKLVYEENFRRTNTDNIFFDFMMIWENFGQCRFAVS